MNKKGAVRRFDRFSESLFGNRRIHRNDESPNNIERDSRCGKEYQSMKKIQVHQFVSNLRKWLLRKFTNHPARFLAYA